MIAHCLTGGTASLKSIDSLSKDLGDRFDFSHLLVAKILKGENLTARRRHPKMSTILNILIAVSVNKNCQIEPEVIQAPTKVDDGENHIRVPKLVNRGISNNLLLHLEHVLRNNAGSPPRGNFCRQFFESNNRCSSRFGEGKKHLQNRYGIGISICLFTPYIQTMLVGWDPDGDEQCKYSSNRLNPWSPATNINGVINQTNTHHAPQCTASDVVAGHATTSIWSASLNQALIIDLKLGPRIFPVFINILFQKSAHSIERKGPILYPFPEFISKNLVFIYFQPLCTSLNNIREREHCVYHSRIREIFHTEAMKCIGAPHEFVIGMSQNMLASIRVFYCRISDGTQRPKCGEYKRLKSNHILTITLGASHQLDLIGSVKMLLSKFIGRQNCKSTKDGLSPSGRNLCSKTFAKPPCKAGKPRQNRTTQELHFPSFPISESRRMHQLPVQSKVAA